MHAIVVVVMAWAGWTWLTGIPFAWMLSQIPAATWVLAWLWDRAEAVDWAAVGERVAQLARTRDTTPAAPAPAVQLQNLELLAEPRSALPVDELAERREGKRAA